MGFLAWGNCLIQQNIVRGEIYFVVASMPESCFCSLNSERVNNNMLRALFIKQREQKKLLT